MSPDRLWGAITSTDALLDATGGEAWVRAMLDAETALARAVADEGLVPRAAAEAVEAACARVLDRSPGDPDAGDPARGPAGPLDPAAFDPAALDPAALDPAALGRAARDGGNPVIPLVAELRRGLPPDAHVALHRGATSQDILDTAAVLVATRALALIRTDVGRLGDACAAVAERYRGDVMAGRTLMQQAAPISFGLKAAGWLTGVTDAHRQLEAAAAALTAQLGGAVGTLASLGGHGPAVASRFAAHLGLADPGRPWHAARQRIAGLGAALAVVAGTAAKIALDVALLMQDEVDEAAEPAGPGRGSSSAMPHKRNPVAAAAVSTAARRAAALVPVLLGAIPVEHERGLGGWQAEWEALSELLALAGGAAARTADTVAGLEVDTAAMASNLAASGGRLMSERVAVALAGRMGPAGRDAVTAAAGRAGRHGSFADELARDPAVAAALPAGELDALLDPAGWLGSTDTWIDRAVEEWRNR